MRSAMKVFCSLCIGGVPGVSAFYAVYMLPYAMSGNLFIWDVCVGMRSSMKVFYSECMVDVPSEIALYAT